MDQVLWCMKLVSSTAFSRLCLQHISNVLDTDRNPPFFRPSVYAVELFYLPSTSRCCDFRSACVIVEFCRVLLLCSLFLVVYQRKTAFLIPCHMFGWFFALLCGCSKKRGYPISERCEHCLCETKHPTMLILFILMHSVGIIIYFTDVWLHMEGITLLHGPMIVVVFWSLYYLACTSDPGIITPENAAAYAQCYPAGAPIFPESSECSTCSTVKPARSRHCRLCDRCVARFDHHCAWLNSDVGCLNHRYFLAFLFTHSVECGTAAFHSAVMLWAFIVENQLFKVRFHLPDGQSHEATWLLVIQYVTVKHFKVVGLMFITGCVSLMVFVFFCYHLWLAARNTTTNETFKYDDLIAYLRKDHNMTKAEAKAYARNVYTKGFFGNLHEVFYPPVLPLLRAIKDNRAGKKITSSATPGKSAGAEETLSHQTTGQTAGARRRRKGGK